MDSLELVSQEVKGPTEGDMEMCSETGHDRAGLE